MRETNEKSILFKAVTMPDSDKKNKLYVILFIKNRGKKQQNC